MSHQVTSQTDATGCALIVVRLFWLVAGNLVLLFLSISIAGRRDFSARDFVYWVTVAALIVARYVDITRLGGQTKDCEPVSPHTFRRYALLLLLASGALWALAHYLLPRLTFP